ncbi:MAG: PilZ domain-containing protein [Gemmatimonadetes bacterium]|nr:PilZ domain-containing protein [Gemmatimonadota bacterium]
MNGSDRRRYSRVPLDVTVELAAATSGVANSHSQVQNVSSGGVRVILDERHSVGTTLELRLQLPDSPRTLAVHGRVAWLDEYNIGGDAAYDAGIEFVDLDNDAKARVEQMVLNSPS